LLAGPAEDQYAVAAGHYAAGRWRLASEEFGAFLTQFPGHAMADTVRFYQAEAYVQQGQYDAARQRLAEFLERQSDHKYAPQAMFRQGEVAFFLADANGAKEAFEAFRAKYHDHELNQFVLPYLGDLALDRGDHAAAQTAYAEALTKFPQGPLRDGCRFGLARAMESLGDTAGAERFYRYLAYQTKSDLADDAQLRLGMLLSQARRHDEAIRELRRVETEFAQSEHRTHGLYWLARTQFSMQNWEGVIASAAQARTPQDHELAPAFAFLTGEALARVGRTAEAMTQLAEVAAKWPQSEWADDAVQAQIELALVTGDDEKIDALAIEFEQRFAQSNLLSAVKLAHGRSLLRRRKYAEAAALFERLLEPPSYEGQQAPSPRQQNLYRYYLGLACLGGDDFERARQTLELIALEGDNSELADGARVARAAALLGLERYQDAVPLLQAYLASQPDGPDAAKCRAQLVVALVKLERLADASAAHELLAQKNSNHPHYLPTTEFLAEAAYAAEDKDLARRLFTQLAREGNPQQYAAKGLSGLAWLEFEGNDAAQSAAAFEKLLRDHPDSQLAAEAAMMQAKSHERLGSVDTAAAMYRLVLDKYASSEQAPVAMLALARLLDQQGRHPDAVALYERYVQMYPKAPDVDAALYQWAWALVDLNQGDEANTVFNRLIEEHPASSYYPDAAYRLAEHAVQTKDYRRAQGLVERILATQPQGDVLAHSLYLQGQIAALEERWPDVAPSMERLLHEFPGTPLTLPASYWAAEGYYRQQQYQEAGRRLNELAPLAEQHNDPWLAMVYLRRAQVLAHEKKWSEAHNLASAIAGKYPEFRQQYEADYLIGRCLMAQAKFSDARAAFENVIRSTTGGRTETAAMAQWMIGETYFHQKNYLEAIKAYHRVERLFPFPRWQAGALLQSGKCHEMRGEFADAVKLYAQLLKDYANTPYSEEASQRLRVAQKRATQNIGHSSRE
jgi:TolA-binding protein